MTHDNNTKMEKKIVTKKNDIMNCEMMLDSLIYITSLARSRKEKNKNDKKYRKIILERII